MKRTTNPLRLPRWLYQCPLYGTFYYRGPNPDAPGRVRINFGMVDVETARVLYGKITQRLEWKPGRPHPLPRSSCSKVGTVYVLRAGTDGPFKIGYTNAFRGVGDRVRSLQTGCPQRIQFIGSRPGTRADEYRALKRLSKFRVFGEWVKPDPQVNRFIARFLGQLKHYPLGFD